MNTFREAVQEYLEMRRSLGFKLQGAGKALPDFVTFMEQHRASYITHDLALVWAQQSSTVQPTEWAHRLSSVRGFARYRNATDRARRFPRKVGCRIARSGRGPTYIRMTRSVACWARLWSCLATASGLGPIIVYSDYSASRACGLEKHAISNFRMSI